MLGMLIFIVWGIVELINVFLLAGNFLILNKRTKRNGNIILLGILYAFVLLAFSYSIIIENLFFAGIFYLPFLLKSFIIINYYYEVNFKSIVTVFFLLLISSTFASNIGIIGVALHIPRFGYNDYCDDMMAAVFLLVVLLILQSMKKYRFINVYLEDLSYVDYMLYLVITYSIAILEKAMFSSSKYPIAARTFSAIAYVFTFILVYKSILTISQNSTLEGMNKLLEEQMKQTTAYYKELVEKEKNTRKFRHDIKNLLLGLYTLISENKNDEAISYINELQDILEQGRPLYNSGNFIADAILTEKSKIAEKINTKIVMNGQIPADKIKDVDMVIVLANLLDNAIEACEKMAGEKTITVNTVAKKNIWVINVSNPSRSVNVGRANEITTTKRDPSLHGFGLKNVERVANKYEGSMEIKYESGVFSNKVTMILN
jgi:hypothetical protein